MMMQKFIFALVIACAFAAPDFLKPRFDGHSNDGSVCNEDDTKKGCIGPKECLYPNPKDCESYLQCKVKDDGTWEPIERPCSDGLQWNNNKKECDYVWIVNCKLNSTTTEPETTPEENTTPAEKETTTEEVQETTSEAEQQTTTEEITTTSKSTTRRRTRRPSTTSETTTRGPRPSTTSKTTTRRPRPSTTSETTTRRPRPSTTSETTTTAQTTSQPSINFTCPVEDIQETKCKGPKDCLYSNPKNCKTFIQCTVNADGVTGTPVIMPCALGTQWNDKEKECSDPASPTCPKSLSPVV